jgi:ornithine carbamoyltransferase
MSNRHVIRHFVDLHALDGTVLRRILDTAHTMKRAGKRVPVDLRPPGIEDAVLGLVFEKPSTRTRISFDVAMRQLGGQSITLNNTDLQLGRGESIADTARVLSRYIDIVMVRANAQATVDELARHATIPVVNGLTDKSHPCQIMADLMTFEEHRGPIAGRTVAWVGDGNNVAVSWMHAAVRFGFTLRLACPPTLVPPPEAMAWVVAEGGRVVAEGGSVAAKGASVTLMDDPAAAVDGVDCVVTDTWVSMGQTDAARRKKLLRPYAVDGALMARAAPGAIFMHCLPAYRGNEVTAEVIDGPQSVVFDEAENRLHVQKAILAWCLGGR